MDITSSNTQIAEIPLTFQNQRGEEVRLPSGSLLAVAPPGSQARILETVVEGGGIDFSVELTTDPRAGSYAFSVEDASPGDDGLTITPLEINYTTTEESVVGIVPGTAIFKPRPTPAE